MELKEFIKSTLIEITKGVVDAQDALKETGCLINPPSITQSGENMKIGFVNQYRNIQKIKMNIAVTVVENSGTKANIGVYSVLKAGVNSENLISNEKVSTIEFEIPIALPVMDL